MTQPHIAIVEGAQRPPNQRFSACANCDHFGDTVLADLAGRER